MPEPCQRSIAEPGDVAGHRGRQVFPEVKAVNWLWLNAPLAAVFYLAMTVMPLWLVFKHPDARPASTDADGPKP